MIQNIESIINIIVMLVSLGSALFARRSKKEINLMILSMEERDKFVNLTFAMKSLGQIREKMEKVEKKEAGKSRGFSEETLFREYKEIYDEIDKLEFELIIEDKYILDMLGEIKRYFSRCIDDKTTLFNQENEYNNIRIKINKLKTKLNQEISKIQYNKS